MRIFEKISRRLAITLAGVMACSSFAVAPAMTVFAADDKAEANATKLVNDADFTEVTLAKYDVEKDDDYKLFTIHSDVNGKLDYTIQTNDNFGDFTIYVWAKGEQPVAAKAFEITDDAKENTDYYISLQNNNEANSVKFQIKANITPSDIKESKINKKIESPAKKTIKVKFKKAKKVDGYEFQVSTSKNFDKNVKTKSYEADDDKLKFEKKTGTVEIKKLKSGKKYYVKVRTYIEKNGVKYYSDWSKSQKIKKIK